MKKVYIETLGCPKNIVDSQRLAFALTQNDVEITEVPQEADFIFINTCGFIEQSKLQSIEYILSFSKMRNEIKRKETSKDPKIVVFGCLAERYKEELLKEIPEIDYIFGTRDYLPALSLVKGNVNGNKVLDTSVLDTSVLNTSSEYKDIVFAERDFRRITSKEHFEYIKISEGCNHTCSFCAIPFIRGRQRSRTIQSLVDEAKFLADNGVKELIIVSQDTTSYGIDLYGKTRLVELLYELSKINGIEWIRLHYLYPTEVNEDLIMAVKDIDKVCKYFDIPLQHVSDRILKLMKRGGNKKQYFELIEKIRKHIPDAAIRTTFIVGFPTETLQEFREIKQFIKEAEFTWVGVFEYSHEEGTDAYKLKDNISKISKTKRKIEILKFQQSITEGRLKKLLGKVKKMIVDEVLDDHNYIARTEYNSPEVDGAVHLFSSRKLEKGDIVDGLISKVVNYDIYARHV